MRKKTFAILACVFLAVTQLFSMSIGGGTVEPTVRPVVAVKVETKRVSPSEESGSSSSKRLPCGGPGNSVDVSSNEMSSIFPLPYPNRNPLQIYDESHLTVTSNSSELLKHIAVMMGRTRLRSTLTGCRLAFASSESLRQFVDREMPMWRVLHHGDTCKLERRVRTFVFAITGGKDKRAVYVERTWGQRTPIQWYGDDWWDELRPIVDHHPMYIKDKFKYLTFKISRIWQRVFQDFGSGDYDWYIRLWDDNYFYEEQLFNTLGRLNPADPVMAGKIGWRYLSNSAIFPFAGGGAGWFLSRKGLQTIGPTIEAAEKWFVEFRKRRDIFLPHDIHDEDVFLTAWFHKCNITFTNIPGVEHVSPGKRGKQRCLDGDTLFALRWDPSASIYFNYPATEAQFRIENASYAYTKPVVWHYMSPRRLVELETLLYKDRAPEFAGVQLPATNSDKVNPKKRCYPGTPMPLPLRGQSVFETPLTDPPVEE